MPLGLTVTACATDAAVQNKIYGSDMTWLHGQFQNKKWKTLWKSLNLLKILVYWKKMVAKQFRMKENNKRVGFLIS